MAPEYSKTVTSTSKAVVRLMLVSVFMLSVGFQIQATPSVTGKAYKTKDDSLKLTQSMVRDWIKSRIAVAKLQKKMKAHAADYDDVVHAFFAKRESLLKSRCWQVSVFDAAKERINAAISAMDVADDLAESKADYEKEIADIKSNKYYTDKQKQKMIEGMRMERDYEKVHYIEPTKPDWPAVRPYRSALQQLTQWYDGNSSNPPEVE